MLGQQHNTMDKHNSERVDRNEQELEWLAANSESFVCCCFPVVKTDRGLIRDTMPWYSAIEMNEDWTCLVNAP